MDRGWSRSFCTLMVGIYEHVKLRIRNIYVIPLWGIWYLRKGTFVSIISTTCTLHMQWCAGSPHLTVLTGNHHETRKCWIWFFNRPFLYNLSENMVLKGRYFNIVCILCNEIIVAYHFMFLITTVGVQQMIPHIMHGCNKLLARVPIW
jgi:hypothetical protein